MKDGYLDFDEYLVSSKTLHDDDDNEKQEADYVSANIVKIIKERVFTHCGGYLRLLYPQPPCHPRQRYMLMVK